MNELFQVHMLNEQGKKNAKIIASAFETLVISLTNIVPDMRYSRESSIAVRKLEEACFYMKKAMATQVENQEIPCQKK